MSVRPDREPRQGPAVHSPLRRAAIAFIETYRAEVSHRIGARCRFTTSCSAYGLDAYRRHSFPVATAMTVGRLARCHDPVRLRVLARAVAALAVFAAAALALPMLASSSVAQVSGPCSATLAGKDASTASTPEKAIEVQHDQTVVATGTMASGPVAYRVQLEFAGIRWTAASGTGSGKTWSGNVDVAKYAKYGVGLYKVHATSSNPAGQSCTIDGYLKVVGKSPLTTAAGLAGTVALVGGLALTAGATLRAARPVTAEYDVAHEQAVTQDIVAEAKSVDWTPQGSSTESEAERAARERRTPKCSLFSFLALFLTMQAMLTKKWR